MQGKGLTDDIIPIQEGLKDIENHMLHFLENHDEQRIASTGFAGDANIGKPAMVVSATIGTSPIMLYFGQEVGESGAENAGYGLPTRTSLFDYVSVPKYQKWVNNTQFDGGQLSKNEKDLRYFYKHLLNFVSKSSALMGEYEEIHSFNKVNSTFYGEKLFSFVRYSNNEKLIIVSNFDALNSCEFELILPEEVVKKWQMLDGNYNLIDQLAGNFESQLIVRNGRGTVKIKLMPLNSLILKVSQ
jgi:glycosidase